MLKERLLQKQPVSFCIISGGYRPHKLQTLIDSIKSQKWPAYEVIVAGKMEGVPQGVRYIPMAEEAMKAETSKMRNAAMLTAQHELIVMSDDDLVLDQNFLEAIHRFERDFDILCVKMRNPDGSRCWDWATIGGPTGHRLMAYDERDDHVYVSSGIFVIKKRALSLGLFNEERGFYGGEDVEFSQRLKSRGAIIEFCGEAGAVHDDSRYTQIDDYTRRIFNAHEWEQLSEGVAARGIHPWDGRAFPIPPFLYLRLSNPEDTAISFQFNLVSLPAGHYGEDWVFEVHDGTEVLLRSDNSGHISFSVRLEPRVTKYLSLNCSDCCVGFLEGNYRDQRAVAAFLFKPSKQHPSENDIILRSDSAASAVSLFQQSGVGIFAGCMQFGPFALRIRALVRDLITSEQRVGLELHSVDFWFSQLCLSFDSSKREWSDYLKKRVFSGVNLVCADTTIVDDAFFARAVSSRPGFSSTVAVINGTRKPEMIRDLGGYSAVYTFSPEDRDTLIGSGLHASLITPHTFFHNQDPISVRKLPNQREKSITLLIDRTSPYKPILGELLEIATEREDLSLVLFIVDVQFILTSVFEVVKQLLEKLPHQPAEGSVIFTAGTLESREELEFLRHSDTVYDLLNPGVSLHLRRRLPEARLIENRS